MAPAAITAPEMGTPPKEYRFFTTFGIRTYSFSQYMKGLIYSRLLGLEGILPDHEIVFGSEWKSAM